jgi:hypothetical protein
VRRAAGAGVAPAVGGGGVVVGVVGGAGGVGGGVAGGVGVGVGVVVGGGGAQSGDPVIRSTGG